ncbi:DUF4917 domain-containing protein [Azospirillum humicireducens]|uniref:DUF4917 domain-containing protein n=1 Tax=Azospirillum humicireducens TaxID=1226968 RepID=A0A168Y2K4_9PROT|nr:DUF4917 family protein [Azospirillum humicireducens]ANC91121.2 DUF4917 domain-containing protein [Azospirillum humicireducens]
MELLTFDTVMRRAEKATNRHLLLGNGFSIALKPDIFHYASLYEAADFSAAPKVKDLFEALGTRDFETVIRHLTDTAKVVRVYWPERVKAIARLEEDAAAIKNALVSAIARNHPARPYEISPEQYAHCRHFLMPFKHIYTLNYDVLLYWALMQTEVDDLKLLPDDGFRHPENDLDAPYVSWQEANSPTVHYLHGALHLFDAGAEITKYTWSKTDVPLVDQIRRALDDSKYPIFVTEGTSASKRAKILHNAYLHKALRSFEAVCKPANSALVIFGHSLAENDQHILRCIAKGAIGQVFVSLYGDPNTAGNKAIIKGASRLMAGREKDRPAAKLNISFFDAASAEVWG